MLTPITVLITVAFMYSRTSANVKSRTCYLRYKNKAFKKVPNLSVQLAFSFRSISIYVPLLSVTRKGNGNFILFTTVLSIAISWAKKEFKFLCKLGWFLQTVTYAPSTMTKFIRIRQIMRYVCNLYFQNGGKVVT